LHRWTTGIRSDSELDLPSRSSTVCSARPNMVQTCPKPARDISPGLRRDFSWFPGGLRDASPVAGTGGHCLDESIQTCPVRALRHLSVTADWRISMLDWPERGQGSAAGNSGNRDDGVRAVRKSRGPIDSGAHMPGRVSTSIHRSYPAECNGATPITPRGRLGALQVGEPGSRSGAATCTGTPGIVSTALGTPSEMEVPSAALRSVALGPGLPGLVIRSHGRSRSLLERRAIRWLTGCELGYQTHESLSRRPVLLVR
jgi:hypothetical protein